MCFDEFEHPSFAQPIYRGLKPQPDRTGIPIDKAVLQNDLKVNCPELHGPY